jgi:hypothetical protein
MAKDFDEVDLDNIENESEGKFMRWMSLMVLVMAVAGFFALAWYAYNSGTSSTTTATDENSVELVRADTNPTKEIPQEPGGQQFPHQDKTVFNSISGGEEKPAVEQILPPSEEPVNRADNRGSSSETQVWMNDKLYEKAHPDVTAGSSAFAKNATEEKPADVQNTAVEEKTPVPVVPFDPKGAAMEQAVPEKPVVETPTQPVKQVEETPVKPVKKAEETPVRKVETVAQKKPEEEKEVKTVNSLSAKEAKVQLGAYKSQEEAEKNWKSIGTKYASLVSDKQHRIFRVDLGSKGIFYRLQVGSFESAGAAQAFCRSLTAKGQGCFLVGK